MRCEGLRELALFAGAGGGILGGKLLGWRTVCAVEIAAYPREALLARQRDGLLPRFPIWDDARTFDGHPWRGSVDVVSGGFPCQDVSAAGKGGGLAGARSGLWSEMRRIVEEVRPIFVFAENSPYLRTRGLGTVVSDLEALGYDVRWGVLGARHLGGPHRRRRLWIRASHPDRQRLRDEQQRQARGRNDIQTGREGEFVHHGAFGDLAGRGARVWAPQPGVHRASNGVAHWVDRVRATGNGQVPIVAAAAWRILGGSVRGT